MSRLDRVEDWIERADLAQYDAAKLALLCRISYAQLRRYFLAVFGKNPQEFLNEVRLSRAAELLASPEFSVKEIAEKVHFADGSQLCHQFKKRFGCTPSVYLRRCRQRSRRDSPQLIRLGR